MSTTNRTGEPWAQLPRESGPAYEAFRVFLELGGGRTVAEAVRRLGKKKSLIWRWVSRHDWRHRAWLRVWHGGTDRRNVLRFARAIPQSDDHPTPKPVPLLEELIRAAAPSRGLILDPFAGSGPTLVAAERTGRTCFAVELEPRYCDIILARWEALSGARAEILGGGTR